MFSVGHPFSDKFDSRLRGNDGSQRKTIMRHNKRLMKKVCPPEGVGGHRGVNSALYLALKSD
jgi:hypothetical protein